MVALVSASNKWGYIRIISGTILGGVLGFYITQRLEFSYKEKMNERLRQYEKEKKEEGRSSRLRTSSRRRIERPLFVDAFLGCLLQYPSLFVPSLFTFSINYQC